MSGAAVHFFDIDSGLRSVAANAAAWLEAGNRAAKAA